MRNPDYTTERLIETLELLRNEYGFHGYIHAKAIPGADNILTTRLGLLADRVSVNIELPSQTSLQSLAPDKSKESILRPMGFISQKITENGTELVKYRHAPKFAPAGQSTQMIIGATPDTDYQILRLTQSLYKKYKLKRVFFSAYVPMVEDRLLPDRSRKPPLLREHRLYQADWLLRFYGFQAEELLSENQQDLDMTLDPKSNWAITHPELFPVEVNTAPYNTLLRVPGIGVKSARRIIECRKFGSLDFSALRRIGVVLKRARYFLLCSGHTMDGMKFSTTSALRALRDGLPADVPEQLSLYNPVQEREKLPWPV